MATITVDQQKLVLNAFAAVFQNNLLAKDVVTWKKYDDEMSDRNGLKVAEQVGPRYTITQTTNGVVDLSSGVQDSVFGSEQFVVNKTFGASMGWGDFVKIRDIGDARENVALTNAATNLAEQIDAYILGVAALTPNNQTGTVGNGLSTFTDIAQAYTRLKEEGVDDSDLRFIGTYGDKQTLGSSIISLAAPDSLVTNAYRQGFSGSIAGIPAMFTQQLPTLTTGTRTNGTVAGANQNVNYSSVAVSGAPGQYLTQTLNIAGLGAGATIADGEVFTIANVYAYDNRLQASLAPRLQQFRVIGATTADGAGAATVRIFPAIIVPNTGGGSTASVNSAHATVSAAPANSAVVTFAATANTAIKPRLLLKKDMIQVNTADLILPATGTAMRKSLTQMPLSIRMWQDSTFATGNHQVRFDVALTANVRERRRGVRLFGN